MPETKLLKMFCNPNPTPTLNAPARIVIFVRSIPSAPKGDEEPNEQDHIVKHRRDRVRNTAGEMEMVVDVFFQQKPQEPRNQEGNPNRDQEGQDPARRNDEGANGEVRVQRRFDRRDQRSSKPKKSAGSHSTRTKKPTTPAHGRSSAEASADAVVRLATSQVVAPAGQQ